MSSFSKKNILIVSPEPWDHIFVSKHHYAVHLAKMGNRVFFLNPPTKVVAVRITPYPNVLSVHYKGFVKGLQYFPGWLRRWLLRIAFKRLQDFCNAKFDVVWSFDNSVFFDFDALPGETVRISHIVDLNQNFQTKKAASSADYCFCNTELIKSRLLKFNPNVTKINHGFNLVPINEDAANIPVRSKPSALYAGNLSMPYIDWVLLRQIVTEHPEVDFIFIGPDPIGSNDYSVNGKAKNEVIQSANTFFKGRVDSSYLQKYYRTADILLIAYHEAFHDEQANPHKMMEYLGSGKMVVASLTQEYRELSEKGLISMSHRNADYPGIFDHVLKNLHSWNSEVLQHVRKAFALENTYEKQIERISQIMDRN